MLFRFIRTLMSFDTGRRCRVCDHAVASRDEFGISEAVCAPCRG